MTAVKTNHEAEASGDDVDYLPRAREVVKGQLWVDPIAAKGAGTFPNKHLVPHLGLRSWRCPDDLGVSNASVPIVFFLPFPQSLSGLLVLAACFLDGRFQA